MAAACSVSALLCRIQSNFLKTKTSMGKTTPCPSFVGNKLVVAAHLLLCLALECLVCTASGTIGNVCDVGLILEN